MVNKGQKPRKKKSPASSPEIDAWLSGSEHPEEDDVLDVESTEVESSEEEGFSAAGSAFLSARDRLQKITTDFRQFCQCSESDQQLELLGQMQEQVKAVRGVFLGAELSLWARFTSAISTFFFATAQKPGFLTFSSARSMGNALELLTRVVVSGSHWRTIDPGPITALILDPDEACRRALQTPLLSQGMKIAECDTEEQAFLCLNENAFDVIFADSLLTCSNGANFATELRKLRYHHLTPIVLVTSEPDFGSHFAGLINSTCDFIARPIAPTEVVVKALAFGLKHRVEIEQAPQPRRPAAIADRKPSAPVDSKPQEEVKLTSETPEVTLKPPVRPSAQTLHPVEPEVVSRAMRPRSAVERTAELERAQKALHNELAESMRREGQMKQEAAALERKLEALDQVLAGVRSELAKENERRLATEQQVSKTIDDRLLLEKELAVRALEPQAAQQRAAELEKLHHTARSELSGALQREDRLKEQCTTFKRELASANKTLEEARQEMGHEKARRQAVEQTASQLTSRVQELTQKESALRQQLEQLARERVDEASRFQATLRKEVAARHAADKAAADLSAHRTKLEKKLAENTSAIAELSTHRIKLENKLAESNSTVADLTAHRTKLERKLEEITSQSNKAQERLATLESTQKSAQAELDDLLELRRKMEDQSAALAQQMDRLSRTLKPKRT